jgi:hypothetical protein
MNPCQPVAWMVYTQDGRSCYVTDNPADVSPDQRALPLYTEPLPTDEALLRQALAQLEGLRDWMGVEHMKAQEIATITAIKERLG